MGREAGTVVNAATTNWSIIPGPTRAWAQHVFRDLEPDAAWLKLSQQLIHILRLDEADPVAAWKERAETLIGAAAAMNERRFDALHFVSEGTDLTVGLLPTSNFLAAQFETVGGIEHRPNLPSEEIFGAPDPRRTDGVVRATKPLVLGGTIIRGLEVEFRDGRAIGSDRSIPFAKLARAAYLARVQLSATGFYATPKVHYDPKSLTGRPFFYFSYGAACAEVAIDTLTGEYQIDRADVLEDVGRSLNPAIDIGQVEGGFIQGVGWLTTEELWWDKKGELRTHAPSTYKIPTASDTPADFRIALYESGGNREDSIYRSKAVGEPPLMLALFAPVASVLEIQVRQQAKHTDHHADQHAKFTRNKPPADRCGRSGVGGFCAQCRCSGVNRAPIHAAGPLLFSGVLKNSSVTIRAPGCPRQ